MLLTLIGAPAAAADLTEKSISQIEIIVKTNDPDAVFDTGKILERMLTRKDDLFSQQLFDKDLKMLSGEFSKIRPKIKEADGSLCIKITVWPIPKINKIIWTGNKIIKTAKLNGELGVNEGDFFNRETFHTALNKVKELYIKKGYFESSVVYKARPVANTDMVDVLIKVKEGKCGNIRKISFKGVTAEEQSDLQDLMYTRRYNVFLSWLTGHGLFKKEALDQDQMTVLNYFHNKGFADAKVDIKILDDPEGSKILLEISVHRGMQYRFGAITFEGNALLSNKDIESRFLIHPGQIYSPEKIRESVQAIKDFYGQKGYIEAEVQYESHLQENEPVYNIAIQIEEGGQYRIGMIRIFGNAHTQSNVLLRESLLVPGEMFDSRKLKATQKRLEAIGYFKNVNVYAVKSADDLGLGSMYRDVYIEVEEASTGSVSLFVGFSTQDAATGGLELAESNFNFKGLFSIFKNGLSAMRGGGEYFRMRANYGSKQQNYLLTWMNPYLCDTLWRLGFEGSWTENRQQVENIKIYTLGGSAFTAYPINDFWTFNVKYRLRDSYNHARKEATEAQKKQAEVEGLISAGGLSMIYDSTDSSYKPHRGARCSFEAEYVGLGGKFRFCKLNYINSFYQPLWKKGTMKYRADLKFITPISNSMPTEVPMSERYFLGGDTSVRGYKHDRIGPNFPNTDNPTGGVSSCLLSLEYNQEILKILDLFLFADAGSVSGTTFHLEQLRASVGAGVRLQLMGRVPLMIGYGYPLNAERSSDKQKLFFSMTGQF